VVRLFRVRTGSFPPIPATSDPACAFDATLPRAIADDQRVAHSYGMSSLPSHQRKRVLWFTFVGLCLQVPLELWLDHQFVLAVDGSDPFGYNWPLIASAAVIAFLAQWFLLRSPRRREGQLGNFVWLPVFWVLAFFCS
jgi:hypothetical protein